MIELCICIEKAHLNAEVINLFINKYIAFTPVEFEITDDIGSDLAPIEDVGNIKSFDIDNWYEIRGSTNECIFFLCPGKKDGPYTIFYSLPDYDKLTEIALDFYCWEPFTIAYIYDNDFVYWQSQKQISAYEAAKKSYKHLPIISDPDFAVKVIDTSVNPGRRKLIKRMWLMASWVTFFGEKSLEIFKEESILNFPGAIESKKYANGLIYIKIYKDAANSENEFTTLKNFREHLEMSAIELQD